MRESPGKAASAMVINPWLLTFLENDGSGRPIKS